MPGRRVSPRLVIAQLHSQGRPADLRTECLIDLLRRVDKEHNLFVRLKSSFLRHLFAKPMRRISESMISVDE
jgi:hypothetical protein